MTRGRCLILDRDCEIFSLLEPAADRVFDDLAELEVPDRSICVVGRTQTCTRLSAMISLLQRSDVTVIFCNTAEGSDNTKWHLDQLGLNSWAESDRLMLITGGQLPDHYVNLIYHSLVVKTVTLPYNSLITQHSHEIFSQRFKPYNFLFLNGRVRRHRKYLIERFDQQGLLDRALWTDLSGWGFVDQHIQLWQGDQNLMARPRSVRYLPPEYELPETRDRVGNYTYCYSHTPEAKFNLFDGVWQDGYIYPRPYQDTYFSLVTETMFEYPHAFMTEKTAKPMLMGHPWIICSTRGYYRYLRDQGFHTFGHLIDESFDVIDNDQARVERIAEVVADLCASDLASFVASCQDVCYHNQWRIQEFVRQQQSEFLGQFFNFLKTNSHE